MATTPTFYESFDDGLGAFSRAWGPGVDTSVPGQLTIHSAADNSDSGAMMPPTGPSAGFGYGLYTETLQMHNVVGPYGMAGWPASDVWPGPELDMVEIDYNGVPYATVHWKGEDGSNQMQSITFHGVDPTQVHTYAMDWQADHISFFVDGALMGTFTDHIPADYAHGGENEMMGVGMQTWWNNGALDGNNWITIFDASYTATPDGTPVTPVPVTPTPVTPTPADPAPATPVELTAGSGADSLVLKISQDAYQGDARYTVSVDGRQVGGEFAASAAHAAGQSDTLTLKGDWAAGGHQVAVHFLNDAWDGTAATDRNLYVDGAAFDGRDVPGAAQAILSDWADGGFAFAADAAAAPAPVFAGTAGADLFDATPAGGAFTGGAGRDLFVFDAGDGHSTVTDFASGTDKLVLIGFAEADVVQAQATEDGRAGLLLTFGDGAAHGGSVFLEGVTALADRDIIFT